MNCAFDKEKLTGYYDGELEAAEKAEVERHIASCSECLRELGELKSAALLVKELPRLRAPKSIAEGVTHEIQTAGKVHRFAKVRRNLLWACAAAAGVFVALNVMYFTQAERPSPLVKTPPAAAPLATVKAPPAEDAKAAGEKEDARSVDRADEGTRARRMEARKSLGEEAEKKEKQKLDEVVTRTEPEKPVPSRERGQAPAPVAKPDPAPVPRPEPVVPPAALPPAPKPGAATPAPAAPVAKDKDEVRPAPEPPAEKSAAQAPKKDGEGLAKELDAKAKRPDVQAEAGPQHLTLASTQLAKARPVMEETLKKMGVKLPTAPPAPMIKGQSGGGKANQETILNLELTDSQIARLRQELEKMGHSRLVAGMPGDPMLAQFGDTGLYRKKDVASGGAAAPTAKKTAEAAPKAESKAASEGKDSEELLRAAAEADKSGEPRRKVVLHLLDVPFMPDPQPAGDPVKK